MSRRPTLRDRTEYVLFRGVVAFVRALPRRAALAVGRGLGDFAFDVLRLRRRVALENLTLAEPDPARRTALARKVYRNLGETFVEFARLPQDGETTFRERLTIAGEEAVAEAVKRGHTLVFVSGHFGSWEVFGAAFAARGYPISYVVAGQRNPLVGAFIDRTRQQMGIRTYPVGASVRQALRQLREKRSLVLLVDQDAGSDGIFVPFLGRSASTTMGPALIAQRSGALLVPGFFLRRGDGRHHMEMCEPFPVGEGLEEAETAARRYTALMETYVRRYPDHWFWVHRRWKTRPRPAP